MTLHEAAGAVEPVANVAAECETFARYLAGVAPSSYVAACYARLLPTASVSARASSRLIERSLVTVARWSTLSARVADGYARFFLPRSLLRRRLMLMLAILENSPVSERPLNSGDEGSLIGVGFRLMVTGIASVLCVLAGVILFAPIHVVSGRDRAPMEPVH